jgi:EAL domain-containing protein (putative c-di-GMP-specific phosphodiesterase class I)
MPSPFEHHVFPPGTPIFREGEPGDCAYVIERGRVEISSLRNGRPVRLAVLDESDLFGEMALVDGEVRSATATAVEETEVVVLTPERVQKELQRADPLLHLLLRVTLNRLRSTNRRVGPLRPGPRSSEASGDPSGNGSGPRSEPGCEERREYRAHQELRDQAIRRIKLEQELGKALGDGSLALRYQPIVSLEDRAIVGFEALLRWQHPERGLLPPSVFVPLAEETGLIAPIGLWVLEEACSAIAAVDGSPYVTVNLSPRQLGDTQLVERLPEILRTTGASPGQLVLEITEGALMENPDAARETLDSLSDLGLRLFLDDFGTGYSSLSYLNRFPIAGVKLDRSFVAAMLTDPSSLKIVRSVSVLAGELDLRTVAEGIEEEAQAEALSDLGFENGQGFLFAEPLEAMA